jgi:CheY-like chemotaxis protein
MPRMDGRETLAAIKTDERLKAIPVVILTTSGAAPDIVASYQHRANAYVTKPFGLDDFEATVRQIDRFYREVASLPPATGSGGWNGGTGAAGTRWEASRRALRQRLVAIRYSHDRSEDRPSKSASPFQAATSVS